MTRHLNTWPGTSSYIGPELRPEEINKECSSTWVIKPGSPDDEDMKMFRSGKSWAREGKTLKNASPDCLYSSYFLKGYEIILANMQAQAINNNKKSCWER